MIGARRAAPLLAAAALATAAGCDVSTNDEPVAVEGAFERIVQTTTTTSTTTPEANARTVEVYYLRSTGGATELEAVDREIAADAGVKEALDLLIPRSAPTEPGLSTAIPDSAVLLGTELQEDGTVVVNTQNLFGPTGVQNPQLRNALGQIVCTATGLPSVEAVQFQNEGERVSASTENSASVDRAVDCDDYDQLA